MAQYGYSQNQNADFSQTKRIYSNGATRYLSPALFVRTLLNKEKKPRAWLIYSPVKQTLFCAPCLLFGNTTSFSNAEGFNDWKHSFERVTDHENSNKHKECERLLRARSRNQGRIDQKLSAAIDEEVNYWKNVLRRVVSCVKSLASRGLSFRGHDEKFGSTHNGNFMMLLELLAEFDPFLANHINRFGNKGSGSTSYLSKTIYEELIQLMAKKVSTAIVKETKEAKYYSIIVDSTPDISHVDQLTFIVRYVKNDGSAVERFLTFIENPGHKAEELATAVFTRLSAYDIDIADCSLMITQETCQAFTQDYKQELRK